MRGQVSKIDSAAKPPIFGNIEKVFRNHRFKIAYKRFLFSARVF